MWQSLNPRIWGFWYPQKIMTPNPKKLPEKEEKIWKNQKPKSEEEREKEFYIDNDEYGHMIGYLQNQQKSESVGSFKINFITTLLNEHHVTIQDIKKVIKRENALSHPQQDHQR